MGRLLPPRPLSMMTVKAAVDLAQDIMRQRMLMPIYEQGGPEAVLFALDSESSSRHAALVRQINVPKSERKRRTTFDLSSDRWTQVPEPQFGIAAMGDVLFSVQCHRCPQHKSYTLRREMDDRICEHLTVTEVLAAHPKYRREKFPDDNESKF